MYIEPLFLVFSSVTIAISGVFVVHFRSVLFMRTQKCKDIEYKKLTLDIVSELNKLSDANANLVLKLSDIDKRLRELQSMSVTLNDRLGRIERGQVTSTQIAEEIDEIYDTETEGILVLISENKDIRDLLRDIKRKFNSIITEIINKGFDNIIERRNLREIKDAKAFISDNYKDKLFYFDTDNAISKTINRKIESYITDVLSVRFKSPDSTRQTAFKKASVVFFKDIITIVVKNLAYANFNNLDKKVDYEVAKEYAIKGDVRNALKFAPSNIKSLGVLEATYHKAVEAFNNGQVKYEEMDRATRRLLDAIIEAEF